MSKVASCPATVTILDSIGNQFECPGKYYGDGSITCMYEDVLLMVDPISYNHKDPKRMFVFEEMRWSNFRVKSVLLLIKKEL
jgi:hypothetical protein